jgi:hypothetical protein
MRTSDEKSTDARSRRLSGQSEAIKTTKMKGDNMRKQWQKFIDDNSSNFSYGIVPSLVERLHDAMTANDDVAMAQALDGLRAQGIILAKDGNLYYMNEAFIRWNV